jgi:hypothetical protein
MKKILLITLLLGGLLSTLLAENTSTEQAQNVTLDGLTLGMTQAEVFKLKFKSKQPKLRNLDYIEELYYRGLGDDLTKGFYQYRTTIAEVDAIVWLWFTKDTDKLYAMRVEWRDPALNLSSFENDILGILVEKYGEKTNGRDAKTWKLGDVLVLEKMARVSIDSTYFRNLVAVTYIDTVLQKKHKESVVPYKRPSTGL